MTGPNLFPCPGMTHGKRTLVFIVENKTTHDLCKPWVSVPVNDQDLSEGFNYINFGQFNNYAAQWLHKNLPQTDQPFQCLAYAGPKDLRYPILALAAAKLQKVLVLPSPLITVDAQARILDAKNCALYLRPSSIATYVDSIIKETPHVQAMSVPDTDEFMN